MLHGYIKSEGFEHHSESLSHIHNTTAWRFHGSPFSPAGRISGPDPERQSYRSYVAFEDPDGNAWIVQEITHRAPGRIDPATTTFASANDLASAMQRAAAAHAEHEKRNGQPDANWPNWYAAYMAAEQTGTNLPK